MALPSSSAITLRAGQAARDGDAVVAVGRDHPILRLARRQQPGADGFLADVQVQEAADLALLVQLGRPLLDAADQYHLVVQAQKLAGLHTDSSGTDAAVMRRQARLCPDLPGHTELYQKGPICPAEGSRGNVGAGLPRSRHFLPGGEPWPTGSLTRTSPAAGSRRRAGRTRSWRDRRRRRSERRWKTPHSLPAVGERDPASVRFGSRRPSSAG